MRHLSLCKIFVSGIFFFFVECLVLAENARPDVSVALLQKTVSVSATGVKQRDSSKNANIPIENTKIDDEARAIEAISGARTPGILEHLLLRPLEGDMSKPNECTSITIVYPSIGRTDIDSDIRQWVTEIADAFERNFEYECLTAGKTVSPASSQIELQADYSITRPSSKALSITFELWNHIGEAHPNLDILTLNYSLINGQRLSISDIFAFPDVALKKMSALSRSILQKRYGMGRKEMLYRGTEPLIENFSSLTLIPSGIRVNFQPYQVASWEMGVQKVEIPLEELSQAKPLTVFWGK